MTFPKLLRFLVPATLVFAFTAPAWADAWGSRTTLKYARQNPAMVKAVAKKMVPVLKSKATATQVAKRPALPRR